MTECNSANSDKNNTEQKQKKRNKTVNANGEAYENRNGCWTGLDKAVAALGSLLLNWLLPERIEAELEILNPPGKPGPKYVFPPCHILYVLLLAHSRDMSYRRIVGDIRSDLMGIPLRKLTYSSLHKPEKKFFMDDFGWKVMGQASEKLRAGGIEEVFDPAAFFRSEECPEFRAPQKIPVCRKDAEEQKLKDLEAEKCMEAMAAFVSKDMTYTEEPLDLIIDGSGEGISGPGIYFEYMWAGTYRRFIKQHALIDAETRRPVCFCVTFEKPGDSAVFPFMIRAAKDAGVNIGTVFADGAYDSTETGNWLKNSVLSSNPT